MQVEAHDEVYLMLVKNVQGGSTALHLAAKSGKTECVELLLEKGVDVDTKAFVSTEIIK